MWDMSTSQRGKPPESSRILLFAAVSSWVLVWDGPWPIIPGLPGKGCISFVSNYLEEQKIQGWECVRLRIES